MFQAAELASSAARSGPTERNFPPPPAAQAPAEVSAIYPAGGDDALELDALVTEALQTCKPPRDRCHLGCILLKLKTTAISLSTGLSLAEDVQEPAGEEDEDEEEEDEEEEEEVPDDLAHLSPEAQQRAIKIRAAWQMTLGTLLVLIFSDPMVDCLSALGTRLGLKTPFYVSFVLAPMASNAVRPGHGPTLTHLH